MSNTNLKLGRLAKLGLLAALVGFGSARPHTVSERE